MRFNVDFCVLGLLRTVGMLRWRLRSLDAYERLPGRWLFMMRIAGLLVPVCRLLGRPHGPPATASARMLAGLL